MTTAIATNGNGQIDDKSLLTLVSDGDCSRLSEGQRLAYYKARCDAAGLDYRAQPFQFVKLNNKLVLYALKTCSEQLSQKHGLSVRLVDTPKDVQELAAGGGCRAFTARVTGKDGRETDDLGVVTVKGASGDTLANAIMKGATKAKRRATLSHCGLGMLDETEIETIPRAQPVKVVVHDNDGEPTQDDTLERDLRASVQAIPAAGDPPSEAETREAPPRPPASPASNGKSAGALAHDLIDGIDKIKTKPHYENWKTRHTTDADSLPPPLKKAVWAAYEGAAKRFQ